jgi:hypothetical protein
MLKEFPIPRVSVDLLEREAFGRFLFVSARTPDKHDALKHAPDFLNKTRYTFTCNLNFINNWGK